MQCSNCEAKNKDSSNFCKQCGQALGSRSNANESKSLLTKSDTFIQRNKKVVYTSLIAFSVLFLGSVYAAPKAIDYQETEQQLTKAEQLASQGKFTEADKTLESAENNWALKSQRNLLESREDKYEKHAEDKKILATVDGLKTEGSLDKLKQARSLLMQVNSSYPKYDTKVKNDLQTIQTEIESELRSRIEQKEQQVEQAEQEAQQAQTVAQRQRQAKQQAQEQAESAQAQAQSAEAKAEAAQESAEETEEQVEQQRATVFLNEAVEIYNSINQGSEYITQALETDYDSSVNNLNQARVLFNDAITRAGNMEENYNIEGYGWVPQELADAAGAYNDSLQHVNSFLAELNSWDIDEGRVDYYQEEALDDLDDGDASMREVSEFLDENGR